MPDAVAPPPRHPRFPLVDGVRAVAVAGVVAVHVALVGGIDAELPRRLMIHGGAGVTLFFLISGFLLYRPMIAGRLGGAGAPALSGYARRRALRILPAYWLVLTGLVLVPGFAGEDPGLPLLSCYGLVHIYPLGSDWATTDLCGLPQTWSLATELAFYALLPLLAFVGLRLGRGLDRRGWVRLQLLGLAVLALCSIAFRWLALTEIEFYWAQTLAGTFLWFALGMALAVLSAAGDAPIGGIRARVAQRPGLAWLGAAAVYAALAAVLPSRFDEYSRADVMIEFLAFGAIGLLLLLPAVIDRPRPGIPTRVLSVPVVARLGLISYGIFLWHWPVLSELHDQGVSGGLALAVLGIPVTVAVAALSYYAVERPLLRLKYRRGERAAIS